MNSSNRRRTQKCPVVGYRCKRRTRCNETEGRCSIASLPTRQFTRRCDNGSRRQKEKEGDGCAETNSTKYERCKNGTRRDKRTHECDAWGVHMFKNRRKIIARGQHLQRMDKSANARVKRHKRFSFAPDAPGAAEHRERMLKDYVPEESNGPPSPVPSPKPKSPRRPNENLADPFKIRVRKSSPPRSPPPRELSVDNDDTTNNHDMNEFDHGDYTDEGNGNAVVEENRPRQLSPILEEEEISPPPFVRRKTPKIQNKTPNTRSSSSRTRSEKAKYKVDYSSNGSRKSKQ